MANTKKPTTFFDGAKLVPEASPTLTDQGTIKFDSATDKLKVRNTASTDAIVQEANTATLTNKALSDSTTTIVDVSDATKKIKFDAAGTTGTTTTITSSQTTNKTLTLPDVTDTLVAKTTTDTLTNKTLTAPVIATIVNSGTLTLPTATDTLVARTTTDTLTNKTLTSPVISTIVNSGTLTLPTSTDTLVGRATTDTLTNKTLTAPVVNSPTGIVKGDVGLGNVDNTSDATKNAAAVTLTNKTLTAPIISTISNTGTLTLPTSTDTLVGKATTDVLTNKTLSGNIATTLVSGAATVTLPTTTGTLATLANAETLSNKTFSDAPILAEIATPSTPASGFGKIYFKSDGFLYQLNDDGTETKVGAGAGGINYISANPDFESGTTGWATYADAAGASPVDGTAGSPTLTFTRTTSSPLRGTGSGLITKDAANRQGNGTSFDFTISDADKFKVLSISFDYEIASGTYADSDLTLWIYDVTNSTLIQPAGSSLANATVESKHQATFQTTSSTSYRLILHCSSTSASSYTVKIDNVTCGPNPVVYGAPISDWKAFTPTSTWVSNTVCSGFRRRVGDSEEFQLRALVSGGAPTAATLTFTLPVTIDTTKLASTTGNTNVIAGSAEIFDSSSGSAYNAQVIYGSSTTVSVAYQNNASGIQGFVNATAPITFANLDEVVVSFTVPVLGYGSTVQMSNDTDSRVVAANFYQASAQTAFTAAVQINFDTVISDTHGAVSVGAGSWKYTAPVAGKYQFDYTVTSANNAWTATNNFIVYLYKNGTQATGTPQNTQIAQATATYRMTASGSFQIDLVAGDYIDLRCSQSVNSQPFSNSGVYGSIRRISGPAAIAASEKIYAEYTTAAGASLASAPTPTIVNYGTRVEDSHGCVSVGASWKFTAPRPDVYHISACAQPSAAANSSEYSIHVYKNGSVYRTLNKKRNNSGGADDQLIAGDTAIKLIAGDYIDVRVGTSTVINLTASALTNHVTISSQ